MNINLPPALFFIVGAVLIVFGALRAYHFGWRRRPASGAAPEGGEQEQEEEERAPGARSVGGLSHKRHFLFGLLWIFMGLFLIISTVVNLPR
jgi:hypothetical protein